MGLLRLVGNIVIFFHVKLNIRFIYR